MIEIPNPVAAIPGRLASFAAAARRARCGEGSPARARGAQPNAFTGVAMGTIIRYRPKKVITKSG